MIRKDYEQKIAMICDLYFSGSQPVIITKSQVCDVWNLCTDLRPDVPGYWMTDAMEKWGKQHGYQLMFHMNKHGKRKNVSLVKLEYQA